jgi:hypothetical protein
MNTSYPGGLGDGPPDIVASGRWPSLPGLQGERGTFRNESAGVFVVRDRRGS